MLKLEIYRRLINENQNIPIKNLNTCLNSIAK